jgi:hypothetical protein
MRSPGAPCLRILGVFAAAVLLCGLTGCSSNAPSNGTSNLGAGGIVRGSVSCVFETRQVQHCGGANPLSDWAAHCQSGPCPTWLDDHQYEYADLTGSGTCSTVSEYRDVLDFQGSCDDWMNQGDPLTSPNTIYCGHSLIYNEFGAGGGLQYTDCKTCLSRYCPSESAECYPQGSGPPCDSLIRCLRACTVGDTVESDACMQNYANAVDAANAFAACISQSCHDSCD